MSAVGEPGRACRTDTERRSIAGRSAQREGAKCC